MKIKRSRIENYRAITDLSLSISHQMIPIIGINESGKTTVLTAVRCFDWRSDRNDNGLHLVHKNRYAIGDTSSATITASVYLTDRERKELKGEIADKHGTEHPFLQEGYEFLLTRTIPPAERRKIRPHPTPVNSYSLRNDLDATVSNKIVRFLRDRIPVVLYFDRKLPRQVDSS